MKWSLILIGLSLVTVGCTVNGVASQMRSSAMLGSTDGDKPSAVKPSDTGDPTIGKPVPRIAPPSKKQKMLNWENLNPEETSPKRADKVVKTEEEWKKILNKEQYRILRTSGTEPAFCGVLLDTKEEGEYHCAGCDLPLFVTEHKFHSGTGWPSFHTPYSRENLWFKTDGSYGMERVEVNCARCDGHLGHVFPDGPAPSRLRFCINGSGMVFHPYKDQVGKPVTKPQE